MKWLACVEWLEDPANHDHPDYEGRTDRAAGMARDGWGREAEEARQRTGWTGEEWAYGIRLAAALRERAEAAV